jgi:ribosomal protein S14
MINNIDKYKIKTLKILNKNKYKELNYKLITSIKKDNQFFNFIIKNYLLIFYFKNLNYNLYQKSKLKLCCVITNNRHSIHFLYSLNRITLRKYISHGLINGFFKSSW